MAINGDVAQVKAEVRVKLEAKAGFNKLVKTVAASSRTKPIDLDGSDTDDIDNENLFDEDMFNAPEVAEAFVAIADGAMPNGACGETRRFAKRVTGSLHTSGFL